MKTAKVTIIPAMPDRLLVETAPGRYHLFTVQRFIAELVGQVMKGSDDK